MFLRIPFYVLKPADKLMATKPVGFGFDEGEAAHNLFLLKFSFGHRCHYISPQKLISTSVSSRLDYYKSLFAGHWIHCSLNLLFFFIFISYSISSELLHFHYRLWFCDFSSMRDGKWRAELRQEKHLALVLCPLS